MNKVIKTTFRPIFLALLTAFALQAQAQFTLRGELRDASNGEPLPFTNCVLLRGADSLFAYGTTTDEAGHFALSAVAGGSYLLRISAVGYETLLRPIRVPDDLSGEAPLRFSLSPEAALLKEVAVTADRPLYSVDGEKTFYHVDDDPSVQTGTAMDALQNTPGVEVDAAGNISLRGNSSVAVWFNDRPSHLDGEALKQYLQTLPASTIKRIEVIANPSVRYGSNGRPVVNIITTQRLLRNELLCVGVNASSEPRVSPWLSYVWSNDRVSINAWLGGSHNQMDLKMEDHQQLYDANGSHSTDYGYTGRSQQRRNFAYAGVSLEWQLDSLTSLSLWTGGYPGWEKQQNHYDVQRTEFIYNPGNYNYSSTIDGAYRYAGMYGNLYLQHRFDTLGQSLDVSLYTDYTLYHNRTERERIYEVQHALDLLHRPQEDERMLFSTLEVTYVKPYSRTGQVELGGNIRLGREEELNLWDTLDHATEQIVRDARRTYSIHSRGNEASLFAALQQRVGQLTMKGGLRLYRIQKQALYTDLPVETTQYDVDRTLWDVIPSLHASYGTSGGHTFTLSYTRRFQAPDADEWSPYEILQEESFSLGNPDLRSSHTHNLEAGWAWYQGWGSVQLNGYLLANTDEISTLSDAAYHPYFGHVVDLHQPHNIGSSGTVGTGANVTWRPRPFMNVRLYANLYDYSYNIEYRPGEWQDTSMLTFSARLNAWVKLWDKLQLFANGNFRSRSLSLMSTSVPSFTLDIGLSADLFDRRLSLYLNVNDLLHTSRIGTSNFNPYYTTNYAYTYNSRYVSVGLTWRLGKMELESKARQGGGANGPQ
ncbi:MAG: TonB-dependent receptor [Bacteroidales bacterium]|nr:TonB-dependent receptor [Bacteroidales bacterium]